MSQLTARLERDLREIAAGAHPSPSAWDSIVARLGDDRESEDALVLAPGQDRSKRPVWMAFAAAALIVITGSIAVLVIRAGDDHSISTAEPDTTKPTVAPPFVGNWVSIDSDGSSQTMEIVRSGGDDYEIVIRDDFASTACSGAPATLTGTGLLATDERLVIARPELTCDDGTIPRNGPPPQADLADFTFDRDPVADQLTDRFGIVWRREGSNDEPTALSPVPVPASASVTSGAMWPQSTLDDVRAAQELVDAGDPAHTWQLDSKLAVAEEPWGAEIFARFIEENLGWEKFAGASFSGYGYADGGAHYDGVVFIHCASGQTNPLTALYAEAPPEIRGCAPTIDELTYETVNIAVTQPGRRGPSGIWLVERWEILAATPDPGSLWELVNPDFAGRQVQQVAPPSDAEVAALLEAFLRARVDGVGADQYLLREPRKVFADRQVPLLYATTSGAPYERFETQRMQGPVWPSGWMEYKVRLFAEGETVVEQFFHVVRQNGQLGVMYGWTLSEVPTTENGQPVAVPYNFLNGEVALAATPPWFGEFGDPTVLRFGLGRDQIVIAADPLPVEKGCKNGEAPTDAEALARSITADPDFETTGTLPVSIAGIDGLQIDGVVSANWGNNWSLCYPMWTTDAQLFQMRLYLVDYPGDSAQILTIALIAPEADFERVLEDATPIVESLEFRTRRPRSGQ